MSPLVVSGLLAALGVIYYVHSRNMEIYDTTPLLPQPVTISYAMATMALEDRITLMMQAIANAEGFNSPGSIPQRCNNPGDLKWTPSQFASHVVGKTANGILIFDSVNVGWDALRHQVTLMLTGRSNVYSLSDSLLDVGEKYAQENANDPAGATWANNVARFMGIDSGVTLAEIARA